MKVAVIIPFRGDAQILAWALEGFARQEVEPGMEVRVHVGGDGCAVPAEAVPRDAGAVGFAVRALEWSGVAGAKNRILAGVKGGREGGVKADVVISTNGDTRPEASYVRKHVQRLMSLPEGSMVLGATPYDDGRSGPPTVFDVLKEESPMIFFYGQMRGGQAYDFRHAWGLNTSVRYADLMGAGAFAEALFPYGYEDLELAYKLMGPTRKGVYFDDSIVARHRHPMTWAQYLNREEMLGLMAPVLARVSLRMFETLLGTRDVEGLGRDYRAWTEMDLVGHKWIYQRMQEWAGLPAESLGAGPGRGRMIGTIYQMHLPLKRLAFRLGYLRGLEVAGEERRMERKPSGLWQRALGLTTMPP